ncbi:MAG: enoyl-CoA hydratase/isomerase family protein [Magnetococcales bacterium]|nr:enoyl-CoA hydratase/isomerase family protein [Magnetococcales bacterium]
MNTTWDELRIWRCREMEDGILQLVMDDPDRSVNLLSHDALTELSTILRDLGHYPPKALVIRSGKKGGFIAGADVAAFEKETDPARLAAYVRLGHTVMDGLDAMPFPTLAVIHGHCLGGGLELALACDHRVVVEDPATRLGLPEVQLGIHPGFGGTVRLPALIGHAAAMPLMLSGRTIGAREAARLGLADAAVPARQLDAAVRSILTAPKAAKHPPLWSRALAYWPLRPLAAHVWKRATETKAPQAHYPAPHALIDLWANLANDPEAMLRAERESVAGLAMSDPARQLTRLFFLRERLKGLGKGRCTRECHLHVVGGGVMGGDIAAWCALKGLTVTIQDASPERLGPLFARAARLFAAKAGGSTQARAAMDRLIPDPRGDGVARADVVIEAISESLTAKQGLLRSLEPRMQPDALLATNTSALSLRDLASVLKRPNRLVGLHFFNPVDKMQLVEVVRGPNTSALTMERACAFAVLVDRLPLPVRDGPGFLINRLLMPYLLEAVLMVEEGIAVEAIDTAARRFGMPMGPLLLADQVGLDIVASVANTLSSTLNFPSPAILHAMVADGHLGKKSGQGFYHHPAGKAPRAARPGAAAPEEVTDRLILPMVNMAMTTLRERIVMDADLLDAGMVFGAGFAPFRGGPLSHARELGREKLLQRLRRLSLRYPERMTLDPGWETFALTSNKNGLEVNHEHERLSRWGGHPATLGENVVRLVPGAGGSFPDANRVSPV